MDHDPINLKVDLHVVVAIASIFVILSLAILLIDNRKRMAQGRTGGVPELIVAHLFFISGTGLLIFNEVLDFWVSATLVTSAVLGGIIAGYLANLALMGVRPRWRGWLLCWMLLSLAEAIVALRFHNVIALVTTSTAINTILSLYFAVSIWKRARFLRFDGRNLLTAPFLAMAAVYFGRLVLMSAGADNITLLTATAAITYVLAFSTFVWVFGFMSMRAFLLNQRLDWAARHDPLTGLENRRALAELSRQWPPEDWIFQERRVICACVDLDHFKAVNDTHGHEVGDIILETTGRRMKSLPHSIKARIFRIGGDEFVLWQEVRRDTDVESYIAELLLRLCDEIRFNGAIIQPSVSIGYCDSERPMRVEEMMRKADLALYSAKENGRGCYARHHDEPSKKLIGESHLRIVASDLG